MSLRYELRKIGDGQYEIHDRRLTSRGADSLVAEVERYDPDPRWRRRCYQYRLTVLQSIPTTKHLREWLHPMTTGRRLTTGGFTFAGLRFVLRTVGERQDRTDAYMRNDEERDALRNP